MVAFFRSLRLPHTPRLRCGLLAALLSAAWLTTTGCDDPAGVGLDLVSEGGGDPVRVRLAPSSFEPTDVRKVTGAVRSSSVFSGRVASILVGRVDDPIFGERAANAYINFGLGTFLQDFADQEVTSAQLRLIQTYRYGDTTTVHTATLYDMPDDWDPANAPSDTTFAFGDPVVTFDYRPTDSLVVIDLPDAWIDANESTLRSEDFNDLFHGFHVETDASEAVTGFSAVSSAFRMTTAEDTLNLNVSEIFTHVELLRPARDLPDVALVEDGLAGGVEVELAFDPDSLTDGAMSRAVFNIQADTTLFDQEIPVGFVRPALLQLNLYGVTPEGEQLFLLSTLLNDEGRFEFLSIDLNSPNTFIRSLQDRLYGEVLFDHYLLIPPVAASTVSVVPLYRLNTGENAPETILTIVPLQ